ncbi:MAG: hypothetical protein HYX22_03310 [Candidatus Yanofskybacteria bacterium]|nr:hypothetical protein [Candidatus Yanofskybacteria bacterium]
MRIGVVALSFALRARQEPNPCNVKLARETERVVALLRAEDHYVSVVSQWEIALALKCRVGHVVRRHRDGLSYLDSNEVMIQAKEYFDRFIKVDEVVIVANPFIHLQGARSKAKRFGLKVRKMLIRRIGFDKKSDQWQTRGPVRAFVYTVGRVLFGLFGQKRVAS